MPLPRNHRLTLPELLAITAQRRRAQRARRIAAVVAGLVGLVGLLLLIGVPW